jgi:tRNA (uracil-5-)-methyltransferase TRM9
MDADISQRLIELNHQFYQTFAQPFSITRQRLQPGVRRVVEMIPLEASLLDLGCGNGELWRALAGRGQRGDYLGLDFSMELLRVAEERTAQGKNTLTARFFQADLTHTDWASKLPSKRFEAVVAFAVMHHLPGVETRLHLLHQVKKLLAPQGRLYLSNWQFLNSERLRARIQPWEMIGMTQDQVDAGDYLLDWRQGGYGLRYAHHFSVAELNELAQGSGFRIRETFNSDGKGGHLSIYQVWERRE